MGDIKKASEKAHTAIRMLKESVYTVLENEPKESVGLRVYEIRDKLNLENLIAQLPAGQWGSNQIVSVILYLLRDDDLVAQNPSDDERWILIENNVDLMTSVIEKKLSQL